MSKLTWTAIEFLFTSSLSCVSSSITSHTINSAEQIILHVSLMKVTENLKNNLHGILLAGLLDQKSRENYVTFLLPFMHIWTSRGILNFAGTSHMLVYHYLTTLDNFHCCNGTPAIDTFCTIFCTNDVLQVEKRVIFDALLEILHQLD